MFFSDFICTFVYFLFKKSNKQKFKTVILLKRWQAVCKYNILLITTVIIMEICDESACAVFFLHMWCISWLQTTVFIE